MTRVSAYSSGNRSGAMLLMLLIVTGAVALTLSLSLAQRSVSEVGLSLGFLQMARAQTIADGCSEDALLRLKDDESYSGGAYSYAESGGDCVVTVSPEGGSKYGVTVTATADRWTRMIYVKVKHNPSQMDFLAWTIL